MSTSSHGNLSFDKEYYKRFHKEYDGKEFLTYYRWFLGWIHFLEKYLPELRNGKAKNVLEIGCSIGAFSKILKERNFEVVATDVSSYILDKASKLQNGVDFKTLDVERDIKIKNQFDYIVAFEVLEHLKSPNKALVRLRDKLKKEGTLIFSTPYPTKRSLSDPTHINVHAPSWWFDACKNAGFSDTKLKYATFIPFLYRISGIFSIGFPIKTDIPYVNSTCIFICKK